MTLITLHELPSRQQQPRRRPQRPLTMDQTQHTGVEKHGFASEDEDDAKRPRGALPL